MNSLIFVWSLALSSICILLSTHCSAQVVWDRTHLDDVRDGKHGSEKEIQQALSRLRLLADEAVKHEPRSVVSKTELPPSGDVHDYLSYSRYWWPDPSKADGLPYIRKDGVVNRKLVAKGDRVRLGDFTEDVQVLAVAGHAFKDLRYSRHAANMVRVWFLNPATKMNPNLDFGQGVPGRAVGRGPGIIDTRSFMLVLDSVELFEDSIWTQQDQVALQAWFKEFVYWLQTSKLGLHEQLAKNNHGSWYDAQLARYALFADDLALAKRTIEAAKVKRISKQFDSEGKQAEELQRTRSLHYSVFNISALSLLARVGEKVDVDLWEFNTTSSPGLQPSFAMLLPYLAGEQPWPYPQLEPYQLSPSSHLTFRLFAAHFSDRSFTDVVSKIERRRAERDFTALLIK